MPTKAAYELSRRIARQFDRHFARNNRDVVVYGAPKKIDCECVSVGPLGSSVDSNCSLCSGKGSILSDSSVCLTAIVVSAEPRRSITYGQVAHQEPASFHEGSFIVVFKIDDVILNPVRYPDRIIFEETGFSKIGWGNHRYLVKSYVKDGIGAEDNYVKVLVERTEE